MLVFCLTTILLIGCGSDEKANNKKNYEDVAVEYITATLDADAETLINLLAPDEIRKLDANLGVSTPSQRKYALQNALNQNNENLDVMLGEDWTFKISVLESMDFTPIKEMTQYFTQDMSAVAYYKKYMNGRPTKMVVCDVIYNEGKQSDVMFALLVQENDEWYIVNFLNSWDK